MNRFRLLTVIMLAVFMAVGMISCMSTEKTVNDMENLSADLEKNSSDYSVEQWKRAGERLKELTVRVHKNYEKFSASQKKRIGELEGKCAKFMTKGIKDGVVNAVTNFGREIQGFIDGFNDKPKKQKNKDAVPESEHL